MLLAIAVLLSAVLLVIMGVLGWTVMQLMEVKKDKASSRELSDVMDHLNSLSHGVHRSYMLAERRLDKAEGDVRSANEADVSIQARLDSLASKVEKVSGEADDAAAKSREARESVAGLSDETKQISDIVGAGMSRVARLESDILAGTAGLAEVKTDLVEVRALAGAVPDTETYATWTGITGRDLRAKSITLDAQGGAGGYVDAPEVRSAQYGLKASEGGALTGYLRAANGGGLQYVHKEGGGTPPGTAATLRPDGISWGDTELKVVLGGELMYCKNKRCSLLATQPDSEVGINPPRPEPDPAAGGPSPVAGAPDPAAWAKPAPGGSNLLGAPK